MKKNSTQTLTYSALLIALGILIPIVMPIKFVFGPASYTLASHVPVMLAMFVSPLVAVLVALGTAFGFFLTFPFIIAVRALSHVLFAFLGAYYLKTHPQIVYAPKKMVAFNVILGIVHALSETAVVSIFFMTGNMGEASYTAGFFITVIVLVGLGGFIHSVIDFIIAFSLAKKLGTRFKFPVFLAAGHKKVSSIK